MPIGEVVTATELAELFSMDDTAYLDEQAVGHGERVCEGVWVKLPDGRWRFEEDDDDDDTELP